MSNQESYSQKNKTTYINTTAIIVAVLGLAATILGTALGELYQGHSNLELQRQKFQSDLILKGLDNESQSERAKYLSFLLKSKLISPDIINTEYIRSLVREPDSIPNLRSRFKVYGLPPCMTNDANQPIPAYQVTISARGYQIDNIWPSEFDANMNVISDALSINAEENSIVLKKFRSVASRISDASRSGFLFNFECRLYVLLKIDDRVASRTEVVKIRQMIDFVKKYFLISNPRYVNNKSKKLRQKF